MSRVMRVVVLGAGYAGLTAVRGLQRVLRRLNVELTLINRTADHELITLLHLAAVEGLPDSEESVPLKAILDPHSATRLVVASVQRIDPVNRLVLTSAGNYAYDRLIVALGSEPNLPDIPGLAKNCFTLRSLPDAHRLRNHVRAMFASAGEISCAGQRQRLLRFVVVGGGSTGCQLAGELSHWMTGLADEFRVPVTDVHLVLVDSSDALMKSLPSRFGEVAGRVLRRKAVDVRLGASVSQVEPQRLRFGDTSLETKTVIWTGGVRVPSLLADSGLLSDSLGRLHVDRKLRIERYPNIYAIGDAARFETDNHEPLAATSAFAIQQGDYVAKAIISELQPCWTDVFRPQDDGMLVSLGGQDAIGKIAGAPLAGAAAGWLKEGIERSYTAGLVRVAQTSSVYANVVQAFSWRNNATRMREIL